MPKSILHRSTTILGPGMLRGYVLKFRGFTDMYMNKPWVIGPKGLVPMDPRLWIFFGCALFWQGAFAHWLKFNKEESDMVIMRRWGANEHGHYDETSLDLVRQRLNNKDLVLARGYWDMQKFAELFLSKDLVTKPDGVDLPKYHHP